ncbi:MAG: class I poly(R)-hydroxyalkanoic acid synthase, partial [Acidobacteria bacterium]|nr:class I poly(R)-hydroxyalkanoic acid synthase [Acidobacteriota bacterium]
MPAEPDDRTREAFTALLRAQQRLLAGLLQQGAAARMPAGELIEAVVAGALADSSGFEALQQAHYREQFELWMRHFGARDGAAAAAAQPAPPHDRRFAASEWSELPWFAWLRDAYLCSSRWLERCVDTAKVDEPTRRKLRFFTRQYLDAMAPGNWAASNPEALRLAFATRGASLARGLENLQADLAKGRISMTDESAFTVGRNLAVTPGAVVFQNALVQVIQYAPATPTVHAVPLVMVPPCINRYYVLDLAPHNSFVRHAVEQGLTVFMISWRNIGPELGRTPWDAYLQQGVMQAIDVARAVTGAPKV